MTAVETSPDLRHARVFVSVLGDEAQRAALDGRPASRRTASCSAASRASCGSSTRRRSSSSTTTRSTARCGSRAARARAQGRVVMGRQRRAGVARRAARRDRARASASCSPRTSIPTATRSARSPRCSWCSPRSARTRSPSWPPTSSRCPTSTASSQLESLVTEPPADLDERTIVFLDCGNIDRNPADALKRDGAHILNIDHHHDNTHFGTVNHVVPDASCTAEMVWDLMRGPRRRARRTRSPRRSTSASSPTPASSCTRTPARARTRWPPS